MLEGVHMIQSNRYTYTTFIDKGLTYSEWEPKIFYLSIGEGGLQKIIEKHCSK